MATLNKHQLAAQVAEETDLSTGQAKLAIEKTLEIVARRLAGGDEILIAGFGKFSTSERAARQGRNPSTGHTMQIAASTGVSSRPRKRSRMTSTPEGLAVLPLDEALNGTVESAALQATQHDQRHHAQLNRTRLLVSDSQLQQGALPALLGGPGLRLLQLCRRRLLPPRGRLAVVHTSMRTDLVLDALRMALTRRPAGADVELIHEIRPVVLSTVRNSGRAVRDFARRSRPADRVARRRGRRGSVSLRACRRDGHVLGGATRKEVMQALENVDEQIESAQLLSAARGGSPEAFVDFYERYWELVVAYFRRRVERSDVAVDLAAEVFAAALQVVGDHGKPLPANPAAWLFSVAHNKYVDAVRRGEAETKARKALQMQAVVLDDEDLLRVDRLTDEDQVLRLLQRLPDDQRQAVWLRVVGEQPYTEVAARLGCSDLVARQRVSRALRTLRTALGGSR